MIGIKNPTEDMIEKRAKSACRRQFFDNESAYCAVQDTCKTITDKYGCISLSSNPDFPREDMAELRNKYLRAKKGESISGIPELASNIILILEKCEKDIYTQNGN